MNFVNKLEKSRGVILEMLENRGFDISKYTNYSLSEIDIMYKNSPAKATADLMPLDMIMENEKEGKKCYIKYLFNSKIKFTNIQALVMDMKEKYEITDTDAVIIITKDKSYNKTSGSDTILESQLESILKNDKVFVQVFWLDTLIINIIKHEFVPKHRIITMEERTGILDKYDIVNYNQLPLILKTDPVAKFLGMRRGDICEITRPSETSGLYISYRLCQ
jgi:DNA-directed RNA polymerases I, II, and III subunit RPABC1